MRIRASCRIIACRYVWFVGLLLCAVAAPLRGQSTDVEYPTPIREDALEGRIVARDLGDARLTRHFYAFTGTPGDLLLRIESANLEGDVDLFLANGLRPVLKVSLFSGSSQVTINKTVYLKRRETVIVRVEARTPDDQPGTYKISFSGSFEVFSGPERTLPGADLAASKPVETPKVRVNSAGARLDPPEPPKPKPTPTPVETIAKTAPPKRPRTPARPRPGTPAPETATTAPTDSTATPSPTPKPSKVKPVRAPAPKPSPPPSEPAAETAGTKPAPKPKTSKPTRPPAPARPKPSPEPEPPTETSAVNEPITPKASNKPVPPKPEPKPAKPKPPVVQTQLIVELKDGTRIVREAVRRVTIDKGEILVVTAEGKIERYPLIEVAKMSVEPAIIN